MPFWIACAGDKAGTFPLPLYTLGVVVTTGGFVGYGLSSIDDLFTSDLNKLTEQATRSLSRQINKAAEAEKRYVFDDGLRNWAESIATCVASHVELYRPYTRKRKPTDRQIAAKERACGRLSAFLGVDLAFEPERWPDSNRVQIFIRSVCFCSSCLPAWFDVGFRLAAGLSSHPPTQMGEDLSLKHQRNVYRSFSDLVVGELMNSLDRETIRLLSPAPPSGSAPPLPEKQGDFSEYFDKADLGDRQRECMSLKYEYQMTKYAIAKHLGLNRKTVDESIASAEKRLERSSSYQRKKTR
jgi:hypothetical protein